LPWVSEPQQQLIADLKHDQSGPVNPTHTKVVAWQKPHPSSCTSHVLSTNERKERLPHFWFAQLELEILSLFNHFIRA
jgi:hypothetical protein